MGVRHGGLEEQRRSALREEAKAERITWLRFLAIH